MQILLSSETNDIKVLLICFEVHTIDVVIFSNVKLPVDVNVIIVSVDRNLSAGKTTDVMCIYMYHMYVQICIA